MAAKDFWNNVRNKMEENGIDFKSEEDIQEQLNIQNEEALAKEKEKKQRLLAITKDVESKIQVRVLTLTSEQLTIQREDLVEDMDRTMVLHSHIIEDIFSLQRALEDIKVIQNSLLCLLHHSLKHKNKVRLKGNKELDTYMASDYFYNEINIAVKRIQSLIEKSNNYSGLVKQKIGFLRDLQKDQTAKRFRGGREEE